MKLEVTGVNNTLLKLVEYKEHELETLRFICSGEVGKYQRGQKGWEGRLYMSWYIMPNWYFPANCWRRIMALNQPDEKMQRPAYHVEIKGLDLLTNPDITPEAVTNFVQTLNPKFDDLSDAINVMYTVLRERYTSNHIATGFGKTYQCYLLSEWNTRVYDGKTLVVVPRSGLVTQGYDDFKSYHNHDGPELQVYGIVGGFKNHTTIEQSDVIIGTFQSLVNMPDDWFQMFSTVVIDEAHMGKANSITEIVKRCTKAEIVTGISGTMVYLTTAEAITVEAFIGPMVAKYTVAQMIAKGRLPGVGIQPIELQLHDNGEGYKAILHGNGLPHTKHRDLNKASAYRRSEIQYITSNKKVLEWLISLCKAYTDHDMNILVLFKNVQPVMTFFDYALQQQLKCHMIHGGTPRDVRKGIKGQIEREGGWILVATDGTMSMGESINHLHAGISFTIGHSPHIALQGVGRQLRNHITKMETTLLYDVYVSLDKVDAYTTSYDVKDHNIRMSYYKQEEYPVKPKQVRVLS